MIRLYARRKLWVCGFFIGFLNVFHLTNNALTFGNAPEAGFLTLVTFAKVFKGKRGFIRVYSMQRVV